MQLPINIHKQLNKVAFIIKYMHVHMDTVLYNSQLLLIDAVFEEPDESDEDMATCYPK